MYPEELWLLFAEMVDDHGHISCHIFSVFQLCLWLSCLRVSPLHYVLGNTHWIANQFCNCKLEICINESGSIYLRWNIWVINKRWKYFDDVIIMRVVMFSIFEDGQWTLSLYYIFIRESFCRTLISSICEKNFCIIWRQTSL